MSENNALIKLLVPEIDDLSRAQIGRRVDVDFFEEFPSDFWIDSILLLDDLLQLFHGYFAIMIQIEFLNDV